MNNLTKNQLNNLLLIDNSVTGMSLICTLTNQALTDFHFELTEDESTYGDIYLGRVTNALSGLSAYFIDYGANKNGFLPASATLTPLKRGDLVIVQVMKSEKDAKGARLSCFVKITGEYYTYMPYGSSMSNKYLPIRKLKGRHGLNAGYELKTLDNEWSAILDAVKTLKGPTLLRKEASLICQLLRDEYHSKAMHIIVDGDAESLKQAVNQFQLAHTIEEYGETLPIFEKYGVANSIKTMTDRVVTLPSGGSISIDVAEAMTCIDVNSSSYSNSNLETTGYQVNLEAAEEICRQIKIRDISGMIAIDFIDMKKTSYIENIQNKMQEMLKLDNVLTRFAKINEFGVLMISRQRSTKSIPDLMTDKCGTCQNGRIKNKYKVVFDVFSDMRLSAYSNPGAQITVDCSTESAHYILNNMRAQLRKLEANGVRITVNWDKDLTEYKVEPKGSAPSLQVDQNQYTYRYDPLPQRIHPPMYSAVSFGQNIYLIQNSHA